MVVSFEALFKEKKVIVYGELFGNKIQKDGELYTDNQGLSFKVFDVYIDNCFLPYKHAQRLCDELGYNFVPFVLCGTIQEAINYVEKNLTSTFSKAPLEGLVGKPIGDFLDNKGNRIVVKIKRRDLQNVNKN
jgi:ATP-dependent RNA circularization protein (DNA/RNA ligase family)